MKKGLIFLLGFVIGVITLFSVETVIYFASSEEENSGLTLFEEPLEVVPYSSFKVFQVINEKHALAISKEDYGGYCGPIVLFFADENTSFYDGKIIDVPIFKKVWQIGTFKYESVGKENKTVPVVKIL